MSLYKKKIKLQDYNGNNDIKVPRISQIINKSYLKIKVDIKKWKYVLFFLWVWYLLKSTLIDQRNIPLQEGKHNLTDESYLIFINND